MVRPVVLLAKVTFPSRLCWIVVVVLACVACATPDPFCSLLHTLCRELRFGRRLLHYSEECAEARDLIFSQWTVLHTCLQLADQQKAICRGRIALGRFILPI